MLGDGSINTWIYSNFKLAVDDGSKAAMFCLAVMLVITRQSLHKLWLKANGGNRWNKKIL